MSGNIKDLFTGGSARKLAEGETLFHAGDPVHVMFLVTGGKVGLIRHTRSGTPIVLQLAVAGQVLAEASAYSERYHCNAVATAPAELVAVGRARFLRRLGADPRASEHWAASLAHSVQSARIRAEIRTLRTVAERLDAWLGKERALPPRGQWQDLAHELGVTPEALYRELARRR
ncbi:MAG: Crp/Fnr family transcriptional regulator [Rhodobacteraceae bacterium]|nr:Crp/Fnr family transcriptional regulator [Paracoccaceae bacterium]